MMRCLSPFQARRFVPVEIELNDWTAVEPLFERLERDGRSCRGPAELESWLADWGELSAALAEYVARRYIDMTARTDDEAAAQAYLAFVEHVFPHSQRWELRLSRLFHAHPARPALPPDRYEVLDRSTAALVADCCDANGPLEAEEARDFQAWAAISGAMRVPFRGDERTMEEMNRLLEEPERAARQEAWESAASRRLLDADRLETLFEEMLRRRERMAANAGCPSYRDYAWRRLQRFDYTPDQCLRFHAAVEREVLPLVLPLQEERRARLGGGRLRPWDIEVDLDEAGPLRPFTTPQELLHRSERVFNRLDPDFGNGFRHLREQGLLDLENRPGKAPGGFQLPLHEARVPFVSISVVGTHMDLLTLFHEAGHAFHTLAVREEPLLPYRSPPLEFCEVASLTMELIGSEHLDEFYSAAEVRRARRRHFERILESLLWIATVDAFEHWVYSHPGHTRQERVEAWRTTMERFGGLVDWEELEAYRVTVWHELPHLFQTPFYFIAYGIAWLGALSVWSRWKQQPQAALSAYQAALAMGGSRPLPSLFTAAGCEFDISERAVGRLVQRVSREIESLAAD